MAGEKTYLRIPPDSTGKRVRMKHTAQITYAGKSGGEDPSHAWIVGRSYQITGFGHIHIHRSHMTTSDGGVLEVHYENMNVYENMTPTVGADILDLETGLQIATVLTAVDVYSNANTIVGYDNPEFGLNINKFGSAQITFEDGTPELTAFGKLKVNDSRIIASYDFTRDAMPGQFVNSFEGENTTAAWDNVSKSVKLSVGTESGSRTTNTSNLFHASVLGTGTFFQIATRLGDAGKANCVRNWGAFDVFDGVFFQLNGTTVNVVIRCTFNSVTTDKVIPQSQWNRDNLSGNADDENPSGESIDLLALNLYWMDYQYIGGGRTRWGMYINGRREVLHEEIGTTTGLNNSLGNPARPICWSMANTGVTGSTSELYAYGAAVYLEGAVDPLEGTQSNAIMNNFKLWGTPQTKTYWQTGQTRNGSTSVSATLQASYSSPDSTQYLYTVSPSQFYKDSAGALGAIENHTLYQPLRFIGSAIAIATGSPVACEVRMFSRCTMRGLQYNSVSPYFSDVETDIRGDHLAHAIEIGRLVVSDQTTFDFENRFANMQYGAITNLGDQPFGRSFQRLVNFTSNSDKYSTGNQVVKIQVLGNHQYDDKQPVIFKNSAGGADITAVVGSNSIKTTSVAGYTSVDRQTTPTGWYYLALVNNNEAWLYNSQADIEDDRTVRILNVDNITNVAIGDLITVNGSHTALVANIEAGKIYVVRRSIGLTDVLSTGSWTTTSGSGTFTTVTQHTGWQKDYWTSNKALTEADLGISTINISDAQDIGIVLFSGNTPRRAWTLMGRWPSTTAPDADGDVGPAMPNSSLSLSMAYRYRPQ